MRQFHLQLAFTCPGVAGKNVQDELCAVDHTCLDHLLDIALLRGRQIVIEKDQIRRYGSRGSGNLLKLAPPDQRGRIGSIAALKKLANHLGAGARRQRAQLVERLFRTELRYVRQLGPGQGANHGAVGRQSPRRERSLIALQTHRSPTHGTVSKAHEERALRLPR